MTIIVSDRQFAIRDVIDELIGAQSTASIEFLLPDGLVIGLAKTSYIRQAGV